MTIPATESENIEFKLKARGLEREIVAFANQRGGEIYIGVDDRGKPCPLELSNALRSEIATAISNCEPRPEYTLTEREDGVILLEIPEGKEKPYRAPSGFYLRIGANSQKLSRDQVIKFFIDQNRIHFGKQIYKEIQPDQLGNFLNLDQVQWYRETSGLVTPLSNVKLLSNVNLLSETEKDSSPSRVQLSNAALLLFGRNTTQLFPQVRTIAWLMAGVHEILEQQIFEGNLLEQLDGASRYLQRTLKTRYEIKDIQRDENPEFPPWLIREVLLNALIHRDYFELGGETQIKIFPDFIEFSNPGNILYDYTPEEIIGKSLRRNPILAEVMQRIGYIERAGTGLLRVRDFLIKSNKSYELKEEGPFFVFRLWRTRESNLTPGQKELLAEVKTQPGLGTSELAKGIKRSERQTRVLLKELLNIGLITKRKIGRRVVYQLS